MSEPTDAHGSMALAARSRDELERMRAAGDEIAECLRVLGKTERNVVGECLRHQGTFYEFEHYPQGDVYDRDSHCQYYYHAHRGLDGEHGHFHTFVRAPGMPPGVRPVTRAGSEPWPEGEEVVSHLVAVSMDRFGTPIGLFTTNRWVTGENWFAATDVIRLLDCFLIDHADPSWPLNRWLTAMLVLFRPTIEALLLERDAVLHAWQQANPGVDVYESRELEITSMTGIALERQREAVRAALA